MIDKKRSILNVSVSVTFKIITMVMSILVKRYLIQICGNGVNGLNALYSSIIGVLSVAELGLGSAIVFCMYKPIVMGQTEQVSALYGLFRKCYLAIGGVILIAGLVLTPFLPYFAKDYAQLNVNLYSGFVLMLLSVVLTYLFSAKTSLINAYKNNYITTAISSGGIVLQYALQIAVLFRYRSFTAYLICRIVVVLVQWVVTECYTRKHYAQILKIRQHINPETKTQLLRSIKAMFMHKVGTVLVDTVDSMIISICIGVVALGKYSNYVTILTALTGILQMVFSSLTSVIGHLYVQERAETSREYCDIFHLLNFAIASVFMLGYYAIIDSLVGMFFGTELLSERMVAYVITLNGFVQFMRRSVLMFRDATGTFYNDRWKPLVEGTINIILSIVLLRSIGVTGVIAATVLTNLLICHVIEPYMLYKYAFFSSPKEYYIRNYGFILLFCLETVVMECCMVHTSAPMADLLINGCISVVISVSTLGAYLLIHRKQTQKQLAMVRKGKCVNESVLSSRSTR